MKLVHKHIIIASMLACVGMAATAQTPAAATAAPNAAPATHERHERHERMGRHDPAKMQAFQAKHQAALKEKLKITPAQEAAWTSFTAATQMQPKGPRPDREAFKTLTTPQRIDKMREMRTQHAAAADKRDEAVKTFYAALSAEQQKTFDAEHARMGPRGHHGDHGKRGPRDGAPRPPAQPAS